MAEKKLIPEWMVKQGSYHDNDSIGKKGYEFRVVQGKKVEWLDVVHYRGDNFFIFDRRQFYNASQLQRYVKEQKLGRIDKKVTTNGIAFTRTMRNLGADVVDKKPLSLFKTNSSKSVEISFNSYYGTNYGDRYNSLIKRLTEHTGVKFPSYDDVFETRDRDPDNPFREIRTLTISFDQLDDSKASMKITDNSVKQDKASAISSTTVKSDQSRGIGSTSTTGTGK